MVIKKKGQKKEPEQEETEEVTTPSKVKSGNPKVSYDFGKLNLATEGSLKARLSGGKNPFHAKRYKTWNGEIDTVFGGFPYGATFFIGAGGSGKSTLAKEIARHASGTVLYVNTDSQCDDPFGNHVHKMDYVQVPPPNQYMASVHQVLAAAQQVRAELIVIDSLTRLCATKKAVQEADIRPLAFELAQRTEGHIPLIATSEIRGSGQFAYPAGGEAISHAPHMLVWFYQQKITGDFKDKRFHRKAGARVYTVEVRKDRSGFAMSNVEFMIGYQGEVGDTHSLSAPQFINVESLQEE